MENLESFNGRKASFYYEGVLIGQSPDGVELYIKLKKRENPDITLEYLVKNGFIKSIEAYNLANSIWNNTFAITETEFNTFLVTFKHDAYYREKDLRKKLKFEHATK